MTFAPNACIGSGVLVTGAASGTGRKTAGRFARHGAHVVPADVAPAVENAAAELVTEGFSAPAVRLAVSMRIRQ